MQTIISVSIAGIIAGLLFEIQDFANSLPLVKDTLEHRALSRLGWFVVLIVLIHLVLRRYISPAFFASGVSGLVRHLTLGLSTLFVFMMFAINVLGADVLVKLPNALIHFADLWYAIPVAIAIHFVVLFVLNKY